MPAPFKQVYEFPDGNCAHGRYITSVVVDQAEFDQFCDQINGVKDQAGSFLTPEQVQTIREAKHIPMMARGTATERFFKQWDVETKLMCVIVRGHGPKLAEQLMAARGLSQSPDHGEQE